MKRYVIAGALLAALATPVLAAEHSASTTTHYAVIDTVGNCAVVDTKPSPYDVSGLKIVGDESGYPSPDAAAKALKSSEISCKGMIERA
jgi:hypothetical protein